MTHDVKKLLQEAADYAQQRETMFRALGLDAVADTWEDTAKDTEFELRGTA